MGSKGDVKEFFGMGVSEPVSKQCLFFMGSKGDVKEFFGMRLAWRVLASCGCSGVSEPDLLVFGCFGTGPKHCFLWVPKVTRKSFLACVLLGVSC